LSARNIKLKFNQCLSTSTGIWSLLSLCHSWDWMCC
jgi:hypothetical protein